MSTGGISAAKGLLEHLCAGRHLDLQVPVAELCGAYRVPQPVSDYPEKGWTAVA